MFAPLLAAVPPGVALAGWIVGFFIFGFAVAWLFRSLVWDKSRIDSANKKAERIVEDAIKEGELKKKDILLDAQTEADKRQKEADRDIQRKQKEIERERIKVQRELEKLEKRNDQSQKRLDNIDKKEKRLILQEEELTAKIDEQIKELERISGLTIDQAKELLLQRVDRDLDAEYAKKIQEYKTQLKEEENKIAKKIVTLAIQRTAVDHVAETTTSEVKLPSDDMKGRIIGREGRNIRTFETLTGVEVIIDDTPEAVVLSAFDPVRRAIAKLALEKLIQDGRIHPSRIEEMVDKAKKEIDNSIKEAGQQAVLEVGIGDAAPEMIRLLGRLRYRTSYGQNILKHAMEVAFLTGNLASELGTNPILARRCGLFHDIGKAVDHEIQGTHASIGAELARKYKEPKGVVHAIAAHHAEIEQRTIEAVLVQAADAISAARPGVRGETLESYFRRLAQLETLAQSFDGVEKCFAIQAGREIRIMVIPDEVDDATAPLLARKIASRIEDELDYPGQIKVTLIREMRVQEIAK